MVFEAIVCDVVNKILGNYLENLDTKQLKIGVWGGDVILHDLKLRENALDELDLPIQLVYGHLGDFVLKIPWKNLYGQPVEARIENLYVLITPKQALKYSADKEEKYALGVKQKVLTRIDEAKRFELEKEKNAKDKSFTEKLTAQIINNLQIKIANIHIRYEDMTTTGKPFAFGVTLKKLELYTTNPDWVKTFLSEQVSKIFKVAELDSLAAYLNCHNREMFSQYDILEYEKLFHDSIASQNSLPKNYAYVIGPISCVAKLKLNTNPEHDEPPFQIPKVDLYLEMQKLNIKLNDTQFQDLLKLAGAMNQLQLGLPYRKYRPYDKPYKGNSKEWWNFAITCVLEETVRRRRRNWSWEHMKNHRKLCNEYLELLIQSFMSKKPIISPETLEYYEKELDLFNLVLIRNRVHLEVAKKNKEAEIKKGTNTGWFGGWFRSSASTNKADDIVEKFESAMTAEEKQKLYSAIGYHESLVDLILPEVYEATHLKFKLFSLEIGLYCDEIGVVKKKKDKHLNYSPQQLLMLEFATVTCEVTQRPAANSLKIIAGMKEMKLIGLQRGDFLPEIITSKITDEFDLLNVYFETNPLDKCGDQKCKVDAKSLRIIYDSDTILTLLQKFSAPKVNLSEFEEAAYGKMHDISERSALGLEYLVEKHVILCVDVSFEPSVVVIPKDGVYYKGESTAIVLSLGKFTIKSEPRTTGTTIAKMAESGINKDTILQKVMDQAYDKYKVALNDIQILIVKPKEDWKEILLENKFTSMHVLSPTSLFVNASICAIDDDPRLPKSKVEVLVPNFFLYIYENRMMMALDIALSIPTPQETKPVEEVSPLRKASSFGMSTKSLTTFEKPRKSVKPRVKPEETGSVVQYTALELEFSLQEFKVVLIKSEEETDDAETPPETYLTPVEDMSISQSFDAFEKGQYKRLLELKLLQLNVYFIKKTYEMIATVKLGGISLIQDDESLSSSLVIIDTPGFVEKNEYLFVIEYTLADQNSPEFLTKYQLTEQLIQIHFSNLLVRLHQECLQKLLAISDNIQRKIQTKTSQIVPLNQDRIGDADVKSISSKISKIQKGGENLKKNLEGPKKGPKKITVVDSIKMRVYADLVNVSVEITCRKRPIALLEIKNFFADLTMKTSYKEISFGLKNILITDLNEHTVHKNILSIIGENAFKCQVVIYNVEETREFNSDHLKIDVNIGCVKVMFLYWFVNSVLTFLNNFQAAQNALAAASTSAADVAKQNVVEAYGQAKRMRINVFVKAPIIIVPINSKSFEGICLDLGNLQFTTHTMEMKIPNNFNKVIVDEIKLDLNNLKLGNVSAEKDFSELIVDTGKTCEFKTVKNILEPVSFTIAIKRHTNHILFDDLPEIDASGHLKSIQFTLHEKDYRLVMSILEKNLSEGTNEFEIIVPSVKTTQLAVADVHSPSKTENIKQTEFQVKNEVMLTVHEEDETEEKKILVKDQIRFNFQFDGVSINFIDSNNEGLAEFGLYFLSLKGKTMTDGTLSTSIILCDIQLDDKRPGSTSKITRYLSRKEISESPLENGNLKNYKNGSTHMIDVVAIITKEEIFAEVKISGFNLIISLEFLTRICDFFVLSSGEGSDQPEILNFDSKNTYSAAVGSSKAQVAKAEDKKDKAKLKFVLHVEEPDIILVESLSDINTYCIIFNTQIELNYRVILNKQLLAAEIKELKMYMCSFTPTKRESTTHYIIHPCSIVLQGSTPDGEGLHLSLKCSDIIINLSPGTVELVNKAIAVTTMKVDKVKLKASNENNIKNMWEAEKYKDEDFWFMRSDKAEDVLASNIEALAIVPDATKQEQCVIEIPSIVIIFETGTGFFTTPMLFLDTKLEGCCYNWSSKMRIKASMTLLVNYFNNSFAVWEPLIEPIEKFKKDGTNEYEPWQLDFSMEMCQKDEDSEDNNITKIVIKSEENLEITLSKTCYDLLLTLSEAFSEALDEKGLTKPKILSAYMVENNTGFDMTIKFLKSSIFTLNEYYISPNKLTDNTLQKQIIFQSKKNSSSILPEDVLECTVSPGGKVYLQTKRHSMMQENEDDDENDFVFPEYNLIVQIGDIKKQLTLPANKSDTRYFPLYRDINQEPWGIVSEVKSEFGTTKVNIHGVVGIKNHFKTNISISQSREINDDLSFVGNVEPDEVFFLPLYAIYPSSKELYISLPGYTYSVQGIKWNDKITELSYKKQIQCDPISTFEPLHINVIREKTEIYHETTSMHTISSAFYLLHLRPPLYFRNFLPIEVKLSVSGCSVKSDSTDFVDAKTKLPIQKEDFLDYGEKTVSPGDVLQLPTVKLTGKIGETKSYIVLRLLEYLEKDWCCTTEIPQHYEEFETWTFSSYDSAAKMDLDLGVRFENRHGSLMVTLFSPFWLINKTGLLLTYKVQLESINLLYHPPDYQLPILFSFKKKLFTKKNVTIRVENGEWSQKIPLDIAGAAGEVKCELEGNLYKIGVHNHLTHNSLTKQITFIPYFVAINKCNDFSIEIQEHSRPADPWTKIGPHECIPFWPQGESSNRMVARIFGEIQNSVPFPYDEGHHTLLKLDKSIFGALNAEVQVTEGATYITFKQYNSGDAPGLLINHTSSAITFWEKKNIERCVIEPNEKILFTWSNPYGERILVWKDGEHEIETDLRRDGVGEFHLPKKQKGYWVSFLDGLQRVILFTKDGTIASQAESNASLQNINQSFELALHGIGISIVNNVSKVDITYMCIKSSGTIWQYQKSKKAENKRWKQLKIAQNEMVEAKYQDYLNEMTVGNAAHDYYISDNVEEKINFKNMSWKKDGVRKLKRTFYPGIWISIKMSPFQMQIHAKINRIQIDNQLDDCVFPVVLAPIPPPKTVATSVVFKPFIECSIVKRVIPNSNMNQFKYCTLLIQEFHIKVDLLFLTALSEMILSDITDQQAAKLFAEDVQSIKSPLSDLVASHSLAELKHFFDNLHLGPLKIHVSFSLARSEPGALPGILSPIVQGVGVTLTDINDVVFRLAYFQREYSFYTKQQLLAEIQTHYLGQGLKQLYVLVFGLDVLGNPYGLVVGITKGVEDLFYEPFQGAIQGPGEFVQGLALGVKSLFGHTVGGAAEAVSKITGAMGKGIAALTFDKEYQRKRREALNKKPANVQEQIARSGKGLVMGVVDGVTGVFTKPISGAREEGVGGFFKGLGKGAIGLVARPTAGVVDFASGSLGAVKRCTETLEEVQRVRPPRFIHPDNVLKPYGYNEAYGNKMLKEIDKGKYAHTDEFKRCEELQKTGELLIVTNHRIMYTTKNDLFGTWGVQWTYRWPEIFSIDSTEYTLIVIIKGNSKRGLFTSNDPNKKTVDLKYKARMGDLIDLLNSLKSLDGE